MKQVKSDRIIVTGQMRSGTTMLCSFLDGQNKITVFQDLLRVSLAATIKIKPPVRSDQSLSSDQKRKVVDEIVRLTFKEGIRPQNFRNLEWDAVSDISEKRQKPIFDDLADLYCFMLEQLVEKANIDHGVLAGTKVTRSEDLARVCSERGMKAIIILRDPRATFVSHYVRAQKDPSFRVVTDVQHFINGWRESFQIWKQPGKFLSIRYEDFVQDPSLGGKLADYLGRDIDPNAIIKTGNSSFGDKPTGKIRPVAVNRWREHADASHISQIIEGLTREMLEVGYL